jgi:outer membrane PBP1 activator LpoA protein
MIPIHRAALVFVLACLGGRPALCGAADDPASKAAARERRPFVALLLPLSSPAFARPAQAVAAGCTSALAVDGEPMAMQISRTDATPASILAAYRSAVERGAAVIVGPMTRDGVTALARTALSGPPTLALNAPESDMPLPERFFVFGLSAESEARSAARNAFGSGVRSAVVVETNTALSRRVARAFAGEWALLGGTISETLNAAADLGLLKLRMAHSQADMVFLSADADEARAARPYLNNQIPVYAISLVHGGHEDLLSAIDLNGVRFVDMPWLVQPDHPAVMVYPRPDTASLELQRFYALGIDACRLAPLIAARRDAVELDGVTGRLRLAHGTVEGEPGPRTIQDGSAVAVGTPEMPR